MMEQDNHPDILELVAWARGAIPKRRLGEIRAHCRTCPDCDAKLARILLLRSKHRREMRRRARRRRQLQMAAAVLLVVGVGAVFLVTGHSSDPSSELAELATTETIREGQLWLRFGDSLPASADMYEFRLRAGMEALVQRDFPLALEHLEGLHRDYGSRSEVACYLGVGLYLSGDDSPRTRQLLAQGALSRRPLIKRTATWYLANSNLRVGEVEAAKELLSHLDSGENGDVYSRLSRALVAKIEVATSS